MALKHHFERIGGIMKNAIASVRRITHKPTVLLGVPSRMQMDGYCCGVCSARMVAEYHGVYIDHTQVEQFAKQSTEGTDTKPMLSFLRANKLSVQKYDEGKARIATLIDALNQSLPIIVSIPGHYFVLIGYSSKYFYVHDPSAFMHPTNTVLRSKFTQSWTREALIVTGPTSHTKRKTIKKFKPKLINNTPSGAKVLKNNENLQSIFSKLQDKYIHKL